MESKKQLRVLREVKYLSSTGLSLYRKDPIEYFTKYLAVSKPPHLKQTKPMSVGSAFDAKVKSYLYERAYDSVPNEWQFENLFESQVDSHNRDFARSSIEDTWGLYRKCGCLADLLILLDKSIDVPTFEVRMQRDITTDYGDVTIMGIPDLLFKTANCNVILDWKVNGYCATRNVSPRRGFVCCYPDKLCHKDFYPDMHYGIPIVADDFSKLYPDWGMQCTTYSWLLGEPVENRVINMVHQFAWGKNPRIAVHAGLVHSGYGTGLYNEYVDLWNRVSSGQIFDEDNDATIERLNAASATMIGEGAFQETYRALVRSQ